ncbi:substrate-binding domain-containing protein [Streptomyces sp. NPDC056144]|uniref:substrate-binding and vWA domain-containing protein n=1 Tax=unclassified Streptomyces TaxID=2593676 RepID=UPI0035E049AB
MSGHPRGSRSRALWWTAGVGVLAILATFFGVRAVTGDGGRDCAVRLTVNSSTEKAELLAELAQEYGDSGREFGDGACAEVRVQELSSGRAMEALATGWDEKREGMPEPQVWTPSSSLWLTLLTRRTTELDRTVTVAKPVSLATSPLAIGMPRPMAQALGWPDKEVGWKDVLSLTQKGWGAFGHPEWGAFHLGKDNPRTSSSGLASTVAAFYAATGRSGDLTEADVMDRKVREFVAGVESGVLHYASDATVYMANLAEADAAGTALSYTSAIPVQEQLIHLYNQGSPTGDPQRIGKDRKPTVPLVAVHPADGTLMMDHPLVVLPTATDQQKAAAADFQDFLLQKEQQRRFQELGFRDHQGAAGQELTESVGLRAGEKLTLIDPPAPDVLGRILDGWDDLRKKARVVMIMDVSGSMNQPAGDGRSRLEAAKAAAIKALDLYHPDDEVGLWAFSTETEGRKKPYYEILPPRRIADGKKALTGAIEELHAEGGTALYSTVRAAQRAVLGELDTDRINAVVLLTDGRNEYPADNDLDSLLSDIDARNMERSVRVFTVAFSEQADFEALEKIAEASKADAYDARDPAVIDKVMLSVISNF